MTTPTEPGNPPTGPLPPTPLPVWLRVIGAIIVVLFGIGVIGTILLGEASSH